MSAFACLLLASLCAAPGRAQEAPPPPPQAAREPVARKVTEYVNQFTTCNAGAHLDVLAIELQNEPQARGYIVVYGPGGRDGGYAARAVNATKGYLVNNRGVEESRIEVRYGGVYRNKIELLTELWLLPEGARPPPEVEYTNDAASFEGQLAEYETWDATAIGPSEFGGWSDSDEVSLVGFADVLRQRAGTRGYVVIFHGEESAPGAWRRVAESDLALLKEHGFAGDRVRVIFGGYREQLTTQLWVLAEGAPPPAKGAGRERRPGEAVQIGRYDRYEFKYPGAARKVFKDFADVLKADESLTAHVVVRLEAANEDVPGETPPPRGPEEPPDVDLSQLVEGWKAGLKKEFGIAGHRLVVTVVPPGADSPTGSVETWVVPPGAAPPNPFAVKEEEPVVEEKGAQAPGAEENPREF